MTQIRLHSNAYRAVRLLLVCSVLLGQVGTQVTARATDKGGLLQTQLADTQTVLDAPAGARLDRSVEDLYLVEQNTTEPHASIPQSAEATPYLYDWWTNSSLAFRNLPNHIFDG